MNGSRDCHTDWSKSDREEEILYDISYMWNLKKEWYKQNYLQNNKRLTEDKHNCQGEGKGERIGKEVEMDMYTLLCFKWMTSQNLLYSTWNSAQFYAAV